MDDATLRYIQNLEYIEALRCDIEKDIVKEEKQLEQIDILRLRIEQTLIIEAEKLDSDLERCQLSPTSLRLKRLAYFVPPPVKVKVQCTALTKKGKQCVKMSKIGEVFCHMHS